MCRGAASIRWTLEAGCEMLSLSSSSHPAFIAAAVDGVGDGYVVLGVEAVRATPCKGTLARVEVPGVHVSRGSDPPCPCTSVVGGRFDAALLCEAVCVEGANGSSICNVGVKNAVRDQYWVFNSGEKLTGLRAELQTQRADCTLRLCWQWRTCVLVLK